MEPGDVAAMLEEDRAEWARLCAKLDADPDKPLHDPESPDWTSRDVYAHFARWLERSTGQLEAYQRGDRMPKLEGSDDEINARWQAEDARRTLDEARAWANDQFDRRAAAIDAVPADRWDDKLVEIARADGADHIRGHLSYISQG